VAFYRHFIFSIFRFSYASELSLLGRCVSLDFLAFLYVVCLLRVVVESWTTSDCCGCFILFFSLRFGFFSYFFPRSLFCGCVLGARALFLLPPPSAEKSGRAGRWAALALSLATLVDIRGLENKGESKRESEGESRSSAKGGFASARLHAMQMSIAREWVVQVVEVDKQGCQHRLESRDIRSHRQHNKIRSIWTWYQKKMTDLSTKKVLNLSKCLHRFILM